MPQETRKNEPSSKGTAPGETGGSVREVMTRNPECVTENDPIQHAAKLMLSCDCGSIPVVESEDRKRIIGMVTDRDIVVRLVAKGSSLGEAKVSDAMTRKAYTAHETDSLDTVHKIMSDHQVRRIPIVDQNDELVGIVALADVATHNTRRDDFEVKVAQTVEEISEPNRKEVR
ncbi:MAG TPA: CBS domain-containing protein [Thermoanaerobaculia bacterium]|nr:CBS domain-containing protein [Thermoanaerobaculia bacterium]